MFGMNMQNMGMNGMNMQNMGMNGMNMQNMGMNGMNMQNMGMNGMNMQNMGMNGMNMQNMGMNGMNMPNIGMNGMNMPNMSIPGMMGMQMNMNMQGMNIGGNEDWLSGYKMAMSESQANEGENSAPQGNNINCIFKTTQGVVTNVFINPQKTMGELIQVYLKRMGKPELIKKKDGVCFLYNANKIKFDDKRIIDDFFRGNNAPIIMVNDIHSLIGA